MAKGASTAQQQKYVAEWHFMAALIAALLLSTISIAALVLYLELGALKGAAQITPGALDGVPIIGWLVDTMAVAGSC